MEREVIWTLPAKNDLKDIYLFLSETTSETNAYQTVLSISKIGKVLSQNFVAGTKYQSKLDPTRNYEKLVWKHYVIIFRKELEKVLINRVFDTRQNPEKLSL